MGVFLLFFSFILGVLLVSVVSCMFLWRSSPVWPKTVHQLWIELLFQYYGFMAYVEDKLFQQKNVVGGEFDLGNCDLIIKIFVLLSKL